VQTDDDILDLDTELGKEYFRLAMKAFSERLAKRGAFTTQQNQCAVMNYLWTEYPEIRVMMASFPS